MTRVLAILTRFNHHGENAGYKQILKFFPSVIEVGVDEQKVKSIRKIKRKYQFLFEWEAKAFKDKVDLLHVMYGEDYFRFSPWIFPKTPIVATFHQPAETLRREIMFGDLRGKVGRITHFFTKNRFRKLSAAIVTEKSQKEVLKSVMPEHKIFVIPLGVHLDLFNTAFSVFERDGIERVPNQVVTVGNWKRDWGFYLEVIKKAKSDGQDLVFHLVNRKLPQNLKVELQELGVHLHEDISDDELKKLLFSSGVHFLPVLEASGNNALFESLAMGTPIVITDVFEGDFFIKSDCVSLHEKNMASSAMNSILNYSTKSKSESQLMQNEARKVASQYDWKSVAEQTLNVYKMILEK